MARGEWTRLPCLVLAPASIPGKHTKQKDLTRLTEHSEENQMGCAGGEQLQQNMDPGSLHVLAHPPGPGPFSSHVGLPFTGILLFSSHVGAPFVSQASLPKPHLCTEALAEPLSLSPTPPALAQAAPFPHPRAFTIAKQGSSSWVKSSSPRAAPAPMAQPFVHAQLRLPAQPGIPRRGMLRPRNIPQALGGDRVAGVWPQHR